ncbi:MAG: hypothetical protein AAF945_09435 [Actinomycetota bacterium]
MLSGDTSVADAPPVPRGRLATARSVGWLGQTVASICWITSVFVYGLSSAGDWLQLAAASSWLTANVATLLNADG